MRSTNCVHRTGFVAAAFWDFLGAKHQRNGELVVEQGGLGVGGGLLGSLLLLVRNQSLDNLQSLQQRENNMMRTPSQRK